MDLRWQFASRHEVDHELGELRARVLLDEVPGTPDRDVLRNADARQERVLAAPGDWILVRERDEARLREGAWGQFLGNGMTADGITVILLSGFLDLTASRPRRLRTALATDALAEIDTFLQDFAKGRRYDEPLAVRLRAVAEETVHAMVDSAATGSPGVEHDLLVIPRPDNRSTEIEFIAGVKDFNLENQLAMLSEGVTEMPNEAEAPLRLLRHCASSVQHQQYHDTEIVTIRVDH